MRELFCLRAKILIKQNKLKIPQKSYDTFSLKKFKDELKERLLDLKVFTKEDASEFFAKYLRRFDDELEETKYRNIELKRKRSSSSRLGESVLC